MMLNRFRYGVPLTDVMKLYWSDLLDALGFRHTAIILTTEVLKKNAEQKGKATLSRIQPGSANLG